MNIEDILEDLKALYDKYSKVAGILLPIFLLMPKIPKPSEPPTQPPSEGLQIPPDHQALADKIRAYYPWKELTKKCVFVGIESEKLTETCWLWLYIDDKGNSEVATVMTIINWGTYYSLEFARMDGLDGEKLTIEIEGKGKFDNIYNRADAIKGYWGLTVNA